MHRMLLALLLSLIWCIAPAFAANYYVRKSGKDTNAGTSAGAAFLTITKAVSMAQPGDRIYVGKGTYSEAVTTVRAGTSSAKIRLVGDTTGVYTGDKKGSILISGTSGTVFSILHDHFELDSVIVTGGATSLLVNAANTNGIAVINSTIRYGTANCISVVAGRLSLVSTSVQGKNKNSLAGPVVVSGTGSIVVSACTFTFLNGAIVHSSSGSSTIERSTFKAISNTWTVDVSAGTVMLRSSLLCSVGSAGNGIRVAGGTVSVWNNTMSAAGTTAMQQSGGTLTFRNNIVAQSTNGLVYSAGTLTASNNLYWNNGTNYTGTTAGSGDVLADPRFVNSSSNWTLQAISPAIDAGFSATGIVPLDRQGLTRPTATAWDIGAYEVMGPSANVPYFCDFEASANAPAEWTTTTTNTSTALTRFSGPHANNTVGVRLRTTPGTDYTLIFDVYLHNTWDGDHASYGPDRFCVGVDGEQKFAATYARPVYGFPFDWPDFPELWSTGLYSTCEAVFRRVVVDFTATNTVSFISFYTSTMQGWSDEGWSIDNVRVVPASSSGQYRPRYVEVGRQGGFSVAGATQKLGLIAADVNNNGFQDLVQGSSSASTLTLNSDGGFSTSSLSATTGQMAFFDANNNGFLDLACISSATTEGVRVLRGNGNGTFVTMTTLGTSTSISSTTALAVADLNNDGVCDIAAFGNSGNFALLATLIGSPSTPGTAILMYTASTSIFPSANADRRAGRYVASGDINNDGFTDFFYNAFGGTFFVSDGTGAYTRTTLGINPGVADADPNGAVLADINNDNVLDLIVPNRSGSLTYWSRSSTAANFTDQTAARGLSSINNAASVAVGDYDNDGDLDLLMTMVTGQVRLYINSGAPAYTFTLNLLEGLSTENASGDAMFVDIDNDGYLDVAFNSTSTNYPSRLYLNQGEYVYGGESPSNYLMVRMVGQGAGATNRAGIGARVELWNSSNTTFLQRREIGQARGAGGQGPLWVHFGGVDPGLSYTLRITAGSRSYVKVIQPGTVSTTINGTIVPQLYTFDEPASAAVRIVRWQEVSEED